MDKLSYALSYAARGWRVLPVSGKVAVLKDWPNKATTDATIIKNWFGGDSKYGVAVYTGDVYVLDIDKKNGGLGSLQGLEAAYGPMETLTATTPGGGLHYYFKKPKGVSGCIIDFYPGIDFKGERGYVVAPPTLRDGGEYTWEDYDESLAELPDWIMDAISVKGSVIPDGVRNHSLFRYACSMRGKGYEEDRILEEITRRNKNCQPALESRELRVIANSASRYRPNTIVSLEMIGANMLSGDTIMGMSIPKPQWLVENLVPRYGLNLLCGRPGSYKSFLALACGIAVSLGIGMCSAFPFSGGQGGKVLYIGTEGGQQFLRRVQCLYRGFEKPGTDAFQLYQKPPHLQDASQRRFLTDYCLQNDIILLILDTFRTCTELREDQQQGWMPIINWLVSLGEHIAVFVIHHMRKTPPGAESSNLLELASGPGMLTASCDLVMTTRAEHGDLVSLVCAKSRNTELLPPATLALRANENMFRFSDDLPALARSLEGKIISKLKQGALHLNRLRELVGGSNDVLKAVLGQIEAEGKIRRDEEGRYELTAIGWA